MPRQDISQCEMLLSADFMMAFTNKLFLWPRLLQWMKHADSDSGAWAAWSVQHTSEMTKLECHTVHKTCAVNGEHL